MVQHVGDVPDSCFLAAGVVPCPLLVLNVGDHAQGQVVVLGRVELATEPAQLLDQLSAVDRDVAGVHASQKEIRAPVRLEERVGVAVVHLQLVLVAVDVVRLRVAGHATGDGRQGVFGQQVVVVQKGDVPAGGDRERGVGCGRDATVFFTPHDPYARVGCLVFSQDPFDVFGGRTVVGDAQFRVRIRLIQDRFDRRFQVHFRCVVDWHDDGDDRRVCHCRRLGAQGRSVAVGQGSTLPPRGVRGTSVVAVRVHPAGIGQPFEQPPADLAEPAAQQHSQPASNRRERAAVRSQQVQFSAQRMEKSLRWRHRFDGEALESESARRVEWIEADRPNRPRQLHEQFVPENLTP